MVTRSKEETERFYRELVAEQERSGLSIRAFAAERGIPPGTLSSWGHELRRRDAARARGREEAMEAKFVRVSLVGSGAVTATGARGEPEPLARPASAPVVYEVVLGRDRVLRLPAEFEEARVAALVRAVASC